MRIRSKRVISMHIYFPRVIRRKHNLLLIIIILIVLLIVQELFVGTFFFFYLNRYTQVITRPITVKRDEATAPRVGIFVLIRQDDLSEYDLALETLQCYASLHGYSIYIVEDKEGEKNFYNKHCNQPDIMFYRHCVLNKFLEGAKEEWTLFLDADIGVINPNHLIEQYLPSDPSVSLVLLDRIMNHEIAAGHYLIRNDRLGRAILQQWSDYNFHLPNSFHGSDNGAIHMLLLEMADIPAERRNRCRRLWKRAKDYGTLAFFTVCVRNAIGGRINGVEIRGKTHGKRWARDGWLTASAWSPADFLLHGWQNSRRDRYIFARWNSPLAALPSIIAETSSHLIREYDVNDSTTQILISLAFRNGPGDLVLLKQPDLQNVCKKRESAQNLWAYKDTFISSDYALELQIRKVISEMERDSGEKTEIIDELFKPSW